MSRTTGQTVGQFLRTRRARIDPAGLPIPTHGTRRVPGIRREEVAALAGVSTSYYTRIEQGTVSASAAVLESLVGALRLDQEDRRHLFRLAGLGADGVAAGRESLVPGVDRLLRTVTTTPVGVLGRGMQLLGWNPLCHRLFAGHLPFDLPGMPDAEANWAAILFCDPATRQLFGDWEAVARDVTGRLRHSRARHPEDRELAGVIASLVRRSTEFADLWAEYPVRELSLGDVHLRHPEVGDLWVSDTVLRPADDDDQLVIFFQAEPGSESDTKLRRLATQRP